jgi:hypothetical protein
MILVFSNSKKTFRLRPIYFAKETGDNIGDLLVETYERLADAATEYLQKPVTASILWKKNHKLHV